jgi:hypothetical protein
MNKKLPDDVVSLVEEEFNRINFGKLILEISIHDKLPKFRVIKEISIVPGKLTSGEQKKDEDNIVNNKQY